MDNDYRKIAGLQYLFTQINPGSNESPVQLFGENLLIFMFPLSDGYLHATKSRVISQEESQGQSQRTSKGRSHEPDSTVMTVRLYEAGILINDAITIEWKRLKETPKIEDFDHVSRTQLNDYLKQSNNAPGSTLLAAVGIGHHIRFYEKELHKGEVKSLHGGMLHLWEDAEAVINWMEHVKAEASRKANAQLQEAQQATQQAAQQAAEQAAQQAPAELEWYWQPKYDCFERWFYNEQGKVDYEYEQTS